MLERFLLDVLLAVKMQPAMGVILLTGLGGTFHMSLGVVLAEAFICLCCLR